jgi:uncharacterized membrane-anchored protein YjiN (DUF445 family)
LRLPIPHTAIIPTRKDQLGRSLGEFVEENFLAREIVAEKFRGARVGDRLSEWLVVDEHASTVSRLIGAAITGGVDVLRDDDVQASIEHGILSRLQRVEVAPLAGRALAIATTDGRHHELVDAAARGALRYVADHRDELRARFGRESPWWIPETIDERIFEKLHNGVTRFLEEVIDDPAHELRRYFDQRLADLITRLGTDPALQARGEQLKEEFLAHPAVRKWMGSLWGDLKHALLDQSRDPDSELRRRVRDTAVVFGNALRDDPALRVKVERWIEGAVVYLVDSYRHEVADLIETTVEKWPADEAARRIELQVGRDLQFIRINGTLVGGLAGLVIYSISRLAF